MVLGEDLGRDGEGEVADLEDIGGKGVNIATQAGKGIECFRVRDSSRSKNSLLLFGRDALRGPMRTLTCPL